MNAPSANGLVAVGIHDIIHEAPGLLDRGSMLGIGRRVTLNLLVTLADMMPPSVEFDYFDSINADSYMDAIGYVEADHLPVMDPSFMGSEQHYVVSNDYSAEALYVAWCLRTIIPENHNNFELYSIDHYSTLYILTHARELC